jgi:hypothetical protein
MKTRIKSKDWVTLVLWIIIPVVVFHLVIGNFWKTMDITLSTKATIFESLFNMIVLPIYLVIIGNRYIKDISFRDQIIIGFLMVIGIGLSIFLHFRNWADNGGSWQNPDRGTLAVIQLELFIGVAVVLIGVVIRWLVGKFGKRYSFD